MQAAKTFARFVSVPENRSALTAVQELAQACIARGPRGAVSPLLLHGPPGIGKTHLVSALIREVTRRAADVTVSRLSAADLDLTRDFGAQDEILDAARDNDLAVIEDLQRLSDRGVEPLVQLLDHRLTRRRPTVLTAPVGPQGLGRLFPARLLSRLAGGLVVALEPLQASSRLRLLQEFAQRRQLAVSCEVLQWLAEKLNGSGRVLEGCIGKLDSLARLEGRSLDVALVARHFCEQVEAARPTVERIVQRVSGYFGVAPRALQSRRRHRNVLWPRQVGMYLARSLSGLSLDQIGAYFGGRDHTTVLHACRKVAAAAERDALVRGALRQLHADFVDHRGDNLLPYRLAYDTA